MYKFGPNNRFMLKPIYFSAPGKLPEQIGWSLHDAERVSDEEVKAGKFSPKIGKHCFKYSYEAEEYAAKLLADEAKNSK